MKLIKLKNKLNNIKLNIGIWFTHNFKYPYLEFKSGIKNFWKYRKIIWDDRWYDYFFIIELYKFKLKDNIDNWDKSNYVGSNFTKKRMIILYNRLNSYLDNLEELQEQYYYKKITKSQYLYFKRKLISKTWNELGRNLSRFWA